MEKASVHFCLDKTPVGTFRLFANMSKTCFSWTVGFQKQKFLLDSLSCWGDVDKRNVCHDETLIVSWEFPADYFELLERVLARWQIRVPELPIWSKAGAEFWQSKEKRPVD